MLNDKIILWDLDGTLLDFEAAERICIPLCLRYQGVSFDDEAISLYKVINRNYWKALERGEITKEQLYPGRFREWFDKMGHEELDAVTMNKDYQIALGNNPVIMDGTKEILQKLKELGYRQYIVTNGSNVAQNGKLSRTPIGKLVDGVFISEKMGEPKPKKEFFDCLAKQIEGYKEQNAVIIGDSLSSDIKGGNNAGIKTIWFNPTGRPNKAGLPITAIAENLYQIPDILSRIF